MILWNYLFEEGKKVELRKRKKIFLNFVLRIF